MNKLEELINNLTINQDWLTNLAIASLIMFLLSLIFIPWLIARLPANYFVDEKRQISKTRSHHPLIYIFLRIIKNLIGFILMVAGFFMLILPGQGILTILVGVGLTDFPGKFKLMQRLTRQPSAFKAMNWIRRKANREPLQNPH